MRILVIQIIVCIVCGLIIGISFSLLDGGKTHKKASNCPSDEIRRGESNFRRLVLSGHGKDIVWVSPLYGMPVKVYTGKWHRDCLEVIK